MTTDRRLVIGIDFDNTLASYDDLLFRLATEAGLVPAEPALRKRQIRDRVRALPDGEQRWRELQAAAYGTRIEEAVPLPGAQSFLVRAAERGARIHVVSHKTERAAADPDGVDLRDAARSWLEQNGFFAAPVRIARDAVHFEPTRSAKLQRIAALGCTHFVDDLEETYLEPAFPAGVERILLRAGGEPAPDGVCLCASWSEVGERILSG